MTSMVERVARAIAEAEGFHLPNDMSLPYAEGSRIGKSMAKARAAIEAMREPTDDMREAFHKDLGAWLNHAIEDDDHLWKAMIDAALKERT